MRILLVDDDRIFLMICEKLIRLTQFSQDVDVCMNGQEAIDYLLDKSDKGSDLPDVILLDINMPILNGWDFLDEFVHWSTSKDISIPVIIISSTVHSVDTQRAMEYNCIKGFYTKPLSLDDMESMKEKIKTNP